MWRLQIITVSSALQQISSIEFSEKFKLPVNGTFAGSDP
jgi:hypothetical protein